MRIHSRWIWPCLAAILCLSCSPPIRQASKGAAAGIAEALDEPANRAHLLRTIRTPEVRAAIHDAAADATSGVAGAITDEKTAAWVQQFAESVAEKAAAAAVDAALARATTPENERRVQLLAVAVADAVTRAAMSRVAAELPRTVGPALEDVTRANVTAGVHELLASPELRAALSNASFEVAREATLGADEATRELSRTHAGPGFVGRLHAIFTGGGIVAVVGLLALLAVIVGLGLALLRARAKAPRPPAEHAGQDPGHRAGPGAAAAA